MTKRIGNSCSVRPARRVLALVAGAVLLVQCGVTRCPPGTRARFDQCVRLTDRNDSGVPKFADAAVESGVDDADAVETSADGACDAERMWRGGRCVLKEIYVDVLDGNDTNEGTLRSPLKTFKRVAGVAVEGQIVNFEAREYTTGGGEDFTTPIPHGVTLRTRPGSRTSAVFRAERRQSLVFAGSATLTNLEFYEFESVLANTGEQQLSNVTIAFGGGIGCAGDARTRCENCSILQDEAALPSQTAEPLLAVSGSATLVMSKGGTLSMSDRPCETARTELIRVTDAGNLVLEGHAVSGAAEPLVYLQTGGTVKVVSSGVGSACPSGSVVVWKLLPEQPVTAGLDVDGSLFSGGVTVVGSMQSLRVRRSELRGSLVIQSATSGTYDLGLPIGDGAADVGGNTFAHLAVTGSGIVVSASGNEWQPSLQGADEHGHYTPGETRRVNAGESLTGKNFSLTGDGGPVTLRF